MSLKAGKVADFAGSLAERIESEMKSEWQAVKGAPMPDVNPDDRRILFVAIARGVLGYLSDHDDESITRIEYESGGDTFDLDITSVDWDVSL